MPINTKTKNLILIAIFILVIGFGVGKEREAEARVVDIDCSSTDQINTGKCTCTIRGVVGDNVTCGDCQTLLYDLQDTFDIPKYSQETCSWTGPAAFSSSKKVTVPSTSEPDVCGGLVSGILNPFDCFLLYVLRLLGWLLSVSATIFKWVIQPGNILNVVNNGIIYKAWAMVRDTLNISFIMFLLFSAFATVFQVDKYSYKKILLTLVIMALLVNFSFPITRFIIDVSNSMMYYFVDSLKIEDKSAGDFFVTIADKGGLADIIKPKNNVDADTTFLLSAVILVFILAVTFLTIAVLFLIRTIALAILIIFSSLAFVGTAIPVFSSYASDWWKKLFNYAFFGPIMIFMLYIAVSIMAEISNLGEGSLTTIAGQEADPSIISAISIYIIPIVILWMGLGVAQSMSIAGAGAVVGKAQGFMKKVGSAVGRSPWTATKWGAKQTGIPGGLQQKWAHWKKTGYLGSDRREAREAMWAGKKMGIVPAVPNVIDQAQLKRIDEAKKRLNIDGISEADLRGIATTGNQYERAAAIQRLAELGAALPEDLHYIHDTFKETSQVFMQLVNKVKTYDPVAAFSHMFNDAYGVDAPENTRWREMMQSHMRSNQFDAKKLNANSLGSDAFMKLAFQEQAISNDDLEALRKKSVGHEVSVTTSLKKIAGDFSNLDDTKDPETAKTDEERVKLLKLRQQQRINKNVQMAHFAQTGGFHSSIDSNKESVKKIIGSLDKDTAKRMNSATIGRHKSALANNLRTNRYKNIVLNMDNEAAQRELNHEMQNTTETSVTAKNIQRLASKDHDLIHIHNK